jgi:2-polyprenyl-3-methyl-5-hydroxy-6-metoxy-1,4-benzoquinol methylase
MTEPHFYMNKIEFAIYKDEFVQSIRKTLSKERSDVLAEAAFPAYANPNPLISFLFWQRLRTVMTHLSKKSNYGTVMDFGCGSGVMLPFLARISKQVVGVDLDLSPLNKTKRDIPFPDNISEFDLTKKSLSDFDSASFDAIVALDVLEHVDNLPETLTNLCALLAPGGQILVSGPTENLAYRIGRKLSGPEYSGHYHVRNIYEIKDELAQLTQVNTLATLFYPVPLFKVYCGTKN